MKNSKVVKLILLISGLIAIGIGSSILTVPISFYATNGITLEGNISLLNELRASGGALLASGILIVSGVFVKKLTFTSTVISSVLYFSYGLSRLLSTAIDGAPAEGLIQAVILELIIGLACVLASLKYWTHIAKN
jgi:hypothetical protein